MRYFEKVSLKELQKHLNISEEEYLNYELPKRSTNNSAGYDFRVIEDFVINPNEIRKIPTGIKANMESNEVLLLVVRSSLGAKYNLRLCNQVGIIDSDYYNNEDNEGHIFIVIKNEGTEIKHFKKGDKIVQGIFINYLTVTNEEEINNPRQGGFGSTN